MTYHVQILLLVRQPLFDRAALLLTQTSWVLPPLSVGKMTLRLYGALNYSHGLSKGPSFGTGRVPSDILDQFCCDIEAKSLDFRRHSLPPRGPQSSLDTLFFTAVAVFLFKSYFDGFLKEAGRDHYVILKKALKRIWHKLFNRSDDFRVVQLTSSGEVKPEYSFLFSIYAEINSGRKVKFLVREGCSENEYAAAIDAFLNLLENYYSDTRCKGIEIDLDNETDYFGYVLIDFDLETTSLRVVDPITQSQNRRKT